ncbi:spermidine synthase [Catenovulum agarivorans DS-2]|uniref:Spermidine synthase n=1 Tax=Catenovulum agarivorans DS-2 TaxID=1328313 RepID=W7QT89_9ALTE|nr:fused MFS/spermidine synthase [Catenovulum agarivorans]EWH08630.1 spermidine synthase [Catenovulum agarivorans DS-2]
MQITQYTIGLILFAAANLFANSSGFALEKIHKERSIYRNIVITEDKGIRCMRFETRRKKVSNQACINLKQPNKLVFEYVQGTLLGLAHNPAPKRVLILGLGGGTLANVIHQVSPTSEIVSVDIDPAVVKLAKAYFGYQENAQIKSEIKDARVFVKRALLQKQQFDWIILDAFNGDYIPEHLMTEEFLAECKRLLSTNGLLSANTFSTSDLYDHESVTYQKVFNQLDIFKAPTKGNRVIFACNCDNFSLTKSLSAQLNRQLTSYGLDTNVLFEAVSSIVDWDVNARVLTDEYSPANLLK